MNVNSDTCDSQIGISYTRYFIKNQAMYIFITHYRQTRYEQEHTSWYRERGGATVARSCTIGGRALVAGLITQSHIGDG